MNPRVTPVRNTQQVTLFGHFHHTIPRPVMARNGNTTNIATLGCATINGTVMNENAQMRRE